MVNRLINISLTLYYFNEEFNIIKELAANNAPKKYNSALNLIYSVVKEINKKYNSLTYIAKTSKIF